MVLFVHRDTIEIKTKIKQCCVYIQRLPKHTNGAQSLLLIAQLAMLAICRADPRDTGAQDLFEEVPTSS